MFVLLYSTKLCLSIHKTKNLIKILDFLITKITPALAVTSKKFYRTCTHTGGCLPKCFWVSYINTSIHATFRAGLPYPKLVGSKISVLHVPRRDFCNYLIVIYIIAYFFDFYNKNAKFYIFFIATDISISMFII